jgi:uncharacterized repeat protein (TIGR01451 family)
MRPVGNPWRGAWSLGHVTRIVTLVCPVLAAMAVAPQARAASVPKWTVTAVSRPTNLTPGDESGAASFVILVTNTGGAPSDGSAITVTDELPPGVSLAPEGASGEDLLVTPGQKAQKLTCVATICTYSHVAQLDESLRIKVPIVISTEVASSIVNVVRVTGGGGLDATVRVPTVVDKEPAAFGISPGGATTALSSTQAGAHPDITTSIAFNTVDARGSLAGDPKDTIDELPPGFGSDFVDTPSCAPAEFLQASCPIATQVGVITIDDVTNEAGSTGTFIEPVYSIRPEAGEVAKFGFAVAEQFRFEGTLKLRPHDYGATVTFADANEGLIEVENLALTIWGVPAAKIHDPLRWQSGAGEHFGTSTEAAPVPFVSNPTICSGEPLTATFHTSSWEAPDHLAPPAEMPFGPLVGCDRLTMEPTVSVQPSTDEAYAPTGLSVTMKIPQTYDDAEGLAAANLKSATITLPEGVTVNPSAGSGLVACTQAEYEEEGPEYTPGRGCPSASKLGTIKGLTPALSEEATGAVYIAEQYNNPFHSLLALYVVARIPNRGVVVHAAGEVTPNPVTGQLVTRFDDLPPLPISSLTFAFRQGATSPLVSPPACGSYATQALLSSWANPGAVLSPFVEPFSILTGIGGSLCPPSGVLPFAPTVSAGTESGLAGSYSPMTLRIVRNDGEQEITGFSAQLPPGLTANLSGIPFCSGADIEAARSKTGAQEESEPSCPAASQIGHTLVGAGVGSVLAWTPGKVYMAGPYNGAPFSIVAVTSARVGPFDLGTVVVREGLHIDPLTADVTVDAGAPDAIPHIIKGIVVHVRDIRVYIDRRNFTLNPTSCAHFSLSSTVIGAGADFTTPADDVPATIKDPFQAAECRSLKFKPVLKVSTSAKTSRSNGASLTAKLVYPVAPQGSQANIRSVKVDLPRQLPSRLSTLQKACPDKVFEVNPAACPGSSQVGHATAITPILPVPLVGPAYFVSHGGAKFPELIVVLQGYGVTIQLHGETSIRNGITSSTFHTVPDQPVTSFELVLPEGPNSALAAYGSLCAPTTLVTVRKTVRVKSRGHLRKVVRTLKETRRKALTMPTAFIAQNGAEIHQNTPIAVTGCPKQSRAASSRHRRASGHQAKGGDVKQK